MEQAERIIAALNAIAKTNERIADAFEALTSDGATLDHVVGRLDDIENAILQAGGRT